MLTVPVMPPDFPALAVFSLECFAYLDRLVSILVFPFLLAIRLILSKAFLF